MEIPYWYWLVFGMILIMLELVIPSFTIFWFGLGALIVGVLLWLGLSFGVAGQVLIWTVSSVAFTALWFKVLKPRMADKTTAGMALERVLGQVGMAVKVAPEGVKGTIRFTPALMGSEDWSFVCEEPTEIGDRLQVTGLSGNTLICVKKG